MKIFARILFLFLLFISTVVSAQKIKKQKLGKADREVFSNLKKHIGYLASDELEGRRAGTNGENLAKEYIAKQFQQIGLQPKGAEGFFQPFSIYAGKQINSSSYFVINNDSLKTNDDYFVFPFSANKTISATPTIAVQEVDMLFLFDLKDLLEENKTNPHFDLNAELLAASKKAEKQGASSLVFFNSSGVEDGLAFNSKDRTEQLGIPVLYLSKKTSIKYFADPSSSVNISFRTDVSEIKKTGNNIVGYIDNAATNTVVLGAHFDHLGYGEDGNSMLRTGEKLIHNGADDNASGTAALIELARILHSSKNKNNNYLFAAFSAEELGLFGSKFFTENPVVDLKTVNYMINMDMIGRLNDSSKTVTVGGYGTSPQWSSLISSANKKNELVVKVDSSGTGPSDHSSFYRKDIPVLFFFTGLHTDYHKPSDDFDKINYSGEVRIINFIFNTIDEANRLNQKLVFTKTKEAQTTTSAKFSVSMGVMPDYTFSGSGLRCDGVSEGRPAQKAGILAGDIIVQINEHAVTSVETYMQVLGKFKRGDKVIVKYKRGNDFLLTEVQF